MPGKPLHLSASLYAANEGYLDDLPVNQVRGFEEALQGFMKSQHGKLLEKIDQTGDFGEEIQKALADALKTFKANHAW